MRLKPHDRRDRVTLPDITSMVDVVFLLIIFFLTTSTLVRATVAEIDLPEQDGNVEAEPEQRGVVVNILQDSRYIVDGGAVTLRPLLAMIAAEADDAERAGEPLDILIRADRDAPLQPLNELARGLVDLGVQNWKLATRAAAPIVNNNNPGSR